jgi:tetratricopeptide (TPR) repeat protein
MKKFFLSFFLLGVVGFLSVEAQSYEQWINKSIDHLERNRLDSAEYALKKAMQMDPANKDNALLLMSMGVIQRELGRLNDAYVSFTAALASYAEPNVVLHNRASLLCDMEKFDEAMTDYNAILQRDPNDIEAYYRRGLLYLEEKNREKAEVDFKKAQQIDPNDMYSLLSKALIYKLDDNWEAAEKVYTLLIDESENVSSALYMNRAECYVNTEQLFKASADLRIAEPKEKQNPYFYFLRGRVRLMQYDKVAARADFEKAKELGYDAAIADEWISRTHKRNSY